MLSMAPDITIVVPAYNAENFIAETIASVIGQTFSNWEMIVVDDGSVDRTGEVALSFVDERIMVERRANQGVSAARNFGLARARGRYVVFLDADDLLVRTALEIMVGALDQHPTKVACFSQHIKIDEGGERLSSMTAQRRRIIPQRETLRHLLAKNFIVNGGALCIRTAAARNVGGFNPALRLGEDWDFWCRLAILSDFLALPEQNLLLYRQRPTGANFRLRGGPFNPNFEALEVIFSNEDIQRRFDQRELKRFRRLAEINSFWAACRNHYSQGNHRIFLTYLAAGLIRYPESLFKFRSVYLFFAAARRPNAETIDESRNRPAH